MPALGVVLDLDDRIGAGRDAAADDPVLATVAASGALGARRTKAS